VFGNVPFNTQYYFHRTLFYLTTPLFAVLLYYYGDNPEHFDLIYIGALGLSCAFCWADKDTLGALVILLGLWIVSQIIYMLPENMYNLVLVYTLCLILPITFRDNISAKVTLLITLFCIGAEVYWWQINYANKPQIHYFLGLLVLTDLARSLLFKRVFIVYEYFGWISGKTALDWQIRGTLLVGYLLLNLMLFEYFIRHLIGLSQVTFVYYNFTIIANILSGITLVIIYMHYFYNQSKKHLQA
jgi:hypothetical protein